MQDAVHCIISAELCSLNSKKSTRSLRYSLRSIIVSPRVLSTKIGTYYLAKVIVAIIVLVIVHLCTPLLYNNIGYVLSAAGPLWSAHSKDIVGTCIGVASLFVAFINFAFVTGGAGLIVAA